MEGKRFHLHPHTDADSFRSTAQTSTDISALARRHRHISAGSPKPEYQRQHVGAGVLAKAYQGRCVGADDDGTRKTIQLFYIVLVHNDVNVGTRKPNKMSLFRRFILVSKVFIIWLESKQGEFRGAEGENVPAAVSGVDGCSTRYFRRPRETIKKKEEKLRPKIMIKDRDRKLIEKLGRQN
ncbi:hypothetical protein EVAR_28955_1 [Eumeta japonica]|uniref:Uncharacterized protein n=1 Tax=Eumeta variegata TaxID=151549 RepID=A0A4C1VZV0_EUMVA|nr:hypothetical protein EVAR_28955_1 [Eumeta japonica]